MHVLLPKKNITVRLAKAATSSYLVDVSPITQRLARCVGLVGPSAPPPWSVMSPESHTRRQT